MRLTPKQRFMQAKHEEALAAYNAVLKAAEQEWRELRINKRHIKTLKKIGTVAKNPSRDMGTDTVKFSPLVAPTTIRRNFLVRAISAAIGALL